MSNKIGDTSMGGDRILKLGDAVEEDDACNVRSARAIVAASSNVWLKFSGKATLGVGAISKFVGDVPDTSYATGPGYPSPRIMTLTDIYVHTYGNTADQQVTFTVFKNGVATALLVPQIATTNGVVHLGNQSIAIAVNDVIDVEISAGAGTGDISAGIIVFGEQAE